jgi:23S rRNA (guanine2445-N2)-methyltransferase / 23S rRNA (guanine2069-N7)-methyltransferase
VALLDDEVTLSIDTSGDGLHRRGYRKLTGPAQIRETLAAALVQLSFWKAGRPLIDPFCGSGTVVIEAALLGRNLAPGRKRPFAAEHWPPLPATLWEQARQEADDLVGPPLEPRLLGTDADKEVLSLARYHAEQAGVENDVHFQQQAFTQLSSSRPYGCLVTNPPYGIRMGEESELDDLYASMPIVLRHLKTWSHFILTAKSDLEQLFGQQADRRRKLFNGQIECTYYQFHGPRAGDWSDRKVAFGGLCDDSPRQFEDFANRLKKRARHLRRWPGKRGISCYRLYDRDVADVPLAVDRYEEALHLSEYERPHERTTAEHADWLDQLVRIAGETLEVAPENIFLKQRKRQRGRSQYQRVGDQGTVRVVEEGGLKFQINLSDYLDTGLVLDHRLTRQLVREAAAGKNFLNLFGYTGAFSVYAAAGGAARTTTVDLSSVYLDWAQENLRLNGFEVGAAHRTYCQDVWAFFKNLSKQETFDLVVVDPPTFSNSKRLDQDWDVQRDHASLLRQVLAHTAPGGTIYFSTNSRRFKLDESAMAHAKVREISRQTVPEDFRNQRIHRCWRIVKGM